MKPDTFDFKFLQAFLLQVDPIHHFIISPHMLLNKKKPRKQSLSEEFRDEIRPNKISQI